MYECVLVTGGAGFVGSSLAIALKRGAPQMTVVALDNLRRRGSELSLKRLRCAGVVFVHGDVRSVEDLADLPALPELIIECSAEPSAQAGYGSSPECLIRTNVVGCFHCLELARRAKADFIFISTSRVYPFGLLNELSFWEDETRYRLSEEQQIEGASGFGVRESFPLEGARSLYGMTKLASELMVEEYGHAYGLRFIINRCGLLTGPWQMGKSDQGVLAFWMAGHYFRKELRYIGFNGSGKQVRDLLHIDDFCDLLMDQVRHFASYAGQRFNIGGGAACSLSLLEATALCQQITGNCVPIAATLENRSADVRIYLADHRLASAVNGWQPARDARSTLAAIHDWLRAQEASVKPLFLAQLSSASR